MNKEYFNNAKKLIENQYVIFDTNIFIKAFENIEYFKGFFEFLKESNCDVVNFDLVNFEFTRNEYLPEIITFKKEFIANINLSDLPYQQSLLEDALEIARIYSHQGIKKGQISLVDCFLAALLKHYGKKLFLATCNHSDFPMILFDREFIYPIDAENNIFTTAFYRFNSNKWQELKKKLGKIN
jgi:predicted nucleic acid-binding protein